MRISKNAKRLFALMLALAVVFCLIPVQNVAATEDEITKEDVAGMTILADGVPVELEPVVGEAKKQMMEAMRATSMNESENNNTPSVADTLGKDYIVQGTLRPSDKLDFYKFTLSSRSEVYAIAFAQWNTLGVVICDYSVNTFYAGYTRKLGYDSDLGLYGFAAVEQDGYAPTLNAGTYYIGILDDDDYNNYLLSLDWEVVSAPHTHSYGSWTVVTPATCMSKGSESRSCSCGNTETREIPIDPNAHSLIDLPAVAPGCTTTGLSAGKKCSLCDTITTAQTTVPATGHNYNGGTVIAPGTIQYTCNTCGHSYQEVVEEPAAEFVASIGSTQYRTVWDALMAARSGDTVEMIANSDERGKTLFMPSGVTLDLNTYDLYADGLIGLNGSILNAGRYSASGDYGRLYVPMENLALTGGDAFINGNYDVIPVWNGSNAYVLANALINDNPANGYGLTIDQRAKTINFKFTHTIGGSANNAFFKDGPSDNATKFILRLEWESDNGVAFQDFVYKDSFVAAVSGGGYTYTFVLEHYDLLNINVNNLKVTAMILTDCGTITTGYTWGVNGYT